jgi:hypothetical protein
VNRGVNRVLAPDGNSSVKQRPLTGTVQGYL